MRASSINLQFFRNHKGLKLEFPADQNIIVLQGENGAGKSSVLEAFYYAGFVKSFRSRKGDDLVFWDNDYFRIELELASQNASKMEVFYGKWPYNKKVLKINEIEKNTVDFIGNLKTVLFTPKDILMLTEEPSLRRAYLNRLLIQTEPKFITIFSKYQKTLKQRNSFLKSNRNFDPAELEIWDEELAKYGSQIIKLRTEIVEFFSKKLTKHYQEISGKKEELLIEYRHNASDDPQEFQEKLKKSLSKDKKYLVTHIGPHRDDILFFLDEHLLKSSASQGELRSTLLALKLTEAEYIEQKTKELPILLFDDVFSELDPSRQLHLIESLKNYQVFITAAEEHCLQDSINDVHVIEV